MNGCLRVGALLGLMMAASIAGASEEISLEDFAAKMGEYGVPDLSAATYVRIEYFWEPHMEGLLSFEWPVKGNGWMLSESRDEAGNPAKGTFVVNGNEVVELSWGESGRGQWPAGKLDLLAEPSFGPDLKGKWKEANSRLDARQTIRFLKSLEGEEYPAYEIRGESGGRVALFAMGLWQRGEKEAAEEIWSRLAAGPGAETNLLQGARLLAANGEYENLYRRFCADHDWVAYRDGLQVLLDKGPAGWRKVEALRELLWRVEKRLAHPEPMPAVTNGLTEADLKLATRMLGVRASHEQRRDWDEPFFSWQIPSSWLEQASKPLDVELEIRARGISAIPFLLAMAEDDALTEAEGNPGGENDIYGWRSEDSFEMLSRPATRGELALNWLVDMLPESVTGNRYRRNPRRELMENARAFYELHREATDVEMALQDMSRPRGDFNVQAVAYVLERARLGAVPELESFLLEKSLPDLAEGGEWHDDFTRGWRYDKRLDLAARYAAIRGKSAHDFAKAFIRLLRQEAAVGKIPKDKNAEQDAADLERILFQTTLGDGWAVLRETGQIPPKGVAQSVWETRLEMLPPAEAFRLLLVEAAANPAAEARGTLAAQLRRLGEKRAPAGLRPREVAAAWETLITDDRAEWLHSSILVSDRFLVLNEQFFAMLPSEENEVSAVAESRWQGTGRRAEVVLTTHGARGREWLRGRVRQRLAGTPEAELPPYPDATSPDEKTLSDLRKQFTEVKDRAAAADRTASLSLPGHAALSEMLRREPELNATLVEMASRIERVTVEGDAGEWSEKFRAWEGRVPTPGLVEDLYVFCEGRAKASQQADCRLIRKVDFGGCELRVEIRPYPEKALSPNGRMSSVVGVAGLVCGPGIYGAVFRRTSSFGEKKRWWATNPSDEYDIILFHKAVATLLDSSTPASDEGFVVFQNQGEDQ